MERKAGFIHCLPLQRQTILHFIFLPTVTKNNTKVSEQKCRYWHNNRAKLHQAAGGKVNKSKFVQDVEKIR